LGRCHFILFPSHISYDWPESDALLTSFPPVGPGNILTVADDLLKNDGQKFLEMMEQLAERRMQREEEAAGDVEDDSDEEEEERRQRRRGGEDDDDEEDDDEDDEEDEDEDDEDDEDDEEEVVGLCSLSHSFARNHLPSCSV